MWRELLGFCKPNFAIVRGPARFWDQKMLCYIMHASVIMHNMIIENERGQDVDYSHYELFGHPVRVRRRTVRMARSVASYHAIRRAEMHDDLQKDSSRSGGHGMDDKEHHDLCVRYCIVELFVVFNCTICCIER